MPENKIKKIQSLSIVDVEEAGGKGASLGELMQKGFVVPNGFVVLASAYDEFMTSNDLQIAVDDIIRPIDTNDTDAINAASKIIQQKILTSPIDNHLQDEIKTSFAELGAKYVAVRSSMTAEDSTDNSWAGQLDTYLNVSEANLLENLKRCWASLFTPRAIYYRLERHLLDDRASVAVVVQEMVASEVSGTAFSVHPESNESSELVIEANAGLGEAVVSGEVTPATYTIEKNSWLILDKHGDKETLSDKLILELAKLIVAVENHYGHPVDVEWSLKKDTFYLLQCRPITTLISPHADELSILDYLKNQRWIIGTRTDSSLLFFSAKANGYDKYIDGDWDKKFAETLLIPTGVDQLVRAINLRQAKRFHARSRQLAHDNPKLLAEHIDKSDQLYIDIDAAGKRLMSAIERDDRTESISIFEEMIELYEKAGAEFITIFSLGKELTEMNAVDPSSVSAVKKHDIWRNSVVFKEESLGEKLYEFFKYIIDAGGLTIEPATAIRMLTVAEVKSWLNNELTAAEIDRIISSRQKRMYVYAHLNRFGENVIEELPLTENIQSHFEKILKREASVGDEENLVGQVAFSPQDTISGEVIIIKDRNELTKKSRKLDGKILVAAQTTPHFIPFLKNVLAIITDEGGLTCHAAIIAREMKKACIVGTRVATQRLADGDIIEIEPNEGIIRIIKSEKNITVNSS